MISFQGIYISHEVQCYLRRNLPQWMNYVTANEILREKCGLIDFFNNQDEIKLLSEYLSTLNPLVQEEDRTEYGDFQTNVALANKIVRQLAKEGISPQIVIEPTFGKGSFILSALQNFDDIKHVLGVEIYRPYFWETKFSVLDHFLNYPEKTKPLIRLFHQDVFDFNFQHYKHEFAGEKILVLGNPPWVTNSELSSLGSENLPIKSNFKNLNGFDAITGKGNFDIGEYITVMLLRAFHKVEGWMAFLVKNTVIKKCRS